MKKRIFIALFAVTFLFTAGIFLFQTIQANNKEKYSIEFFKATKQELAEKKSANQKIVFLEEKLKECEELEQNQQLFPIATQRIRSLLSKARKEQEDESAWMKAVDMDTIEGYNLYKEDQKNGRYVCAASEEIIKKLEMQIAELKEESGIYKSRYKDIMLEKIDCPEQIAEIQLEKIICRNQKSISRKVFGMQIGKTADPISLLVNGEKVIDQHAMKTGNVKVLSDIQSFTVDKNSHYTISVIHESENGNTIMTELTLKGNCFPSKGTFEQESNTIIGEYILVYSLK